MLKLICDLCGKEETINDWKLIDKYCKQLSIEEPNRCADCDEKWSKLQFELSESVAEYRRHKIDELMVKYFPMGWYVK